VALAVSKLKVSEDEGMAVANQVGRLILEMGLCQAASDGDQPLDVPDERESALADLACGTLALFARLSSGSFRGMSQNDRKPDKGGYSWRFDMAVTACTIASIGGKPSVRRDGGTADAADTSQSLEIELESLRIGRGRMIYESLLEAVL
jgi:hypothetical protein